MRKGIESAVDLIFPPACVGCGVPIAPGSGLCGACWRETHFTGGLQCDKCGLPLPGEDEGTAEYCDDCLTLARPWTRGRAVWLYKGKGRDLVLALKHADRLDLVGPLGQWLARSAGAIVAPDMIAAPVPLHWTRLLRRRYNQAALLAGATAKALSIPHCPDLLQRSRKTGSQDGRNRDARFQNVAGAFRVHPRRAHHLKGRHVLLIDDVMTSGATFAAATDACLAAGATQVSVLALARVAKDD